MRKRILYLLVSVILCITACALPARAEEILLTEDEDTPPEYGPALLTEPAATLTIPEVKAFPPGAMGITFRATVVWAEEDALLVQDETDSIWLSTTESLVPGDKVLISGQTGQDLFLAETALREGTGPLPVVEATLASAPEALRVAIRGCRLSAGILTQDGCSVEIRAGELPDGEADVYGILFDGVFYADTIVPIQKANREWNAYFGLLDAHSSISDGLGSVQEAFSRASQVTGLDFFAVTDHSDSLDNAGSGAITQEGTAISAEWATGKQAAANVTRDDFVGIFGYEMSWSEDEMLGHINTFRTPGWQTPRQSGMDTLAGYCAALAKVPESVSQFNHPGLFYGDFGGFRDYDPACDACVQLLQIEGEGGESFYSYYIQALDCGWHVAPTVGQDNHHGDWGTAGLSRTAVLAKQLSGEALLDAMRARRVYATQDPDLYVDYRLGGSPMGSVIGLASGLEASVVLDDPTDHAEASVAVIGLGGTVLASGQTSGGRLTLPVPDGYPYYFLYITQPDGDVAVTAPVWVDDFTDAGIASFSASTQTPTAGEAVELTLDLYNWEEVPFTVSGAAVYCGGQKLGDFTSTGSLGYTCTLLWTQPGEVRLTAVVQGTVNGTARSYETNLTLRFQAPDPVRASIRQVRLGTAGTVYAIEGYATSGNTNPHTTFPDTIYVQDDTGGIPVKGAFSQRIQVGTPLALTGVLREGAGEPYLELTACQVPGGAMYRYVPQSLSCLSTTDPILLGGCLVQTRGTVTALTRNGNTISRFTLQDDSGTAEIVIDPQIHSGSYGVNDLARQVTLGGTVRVIGLLSRNEAGQTFLRVRNCDEVVSLTAMTARSRTAEVLADESNPPTGDLDFFRLFTDLLW